MISHRCATAAAGVLFLFPVVAYAQPTIPGTTPFSEGEKQALACRNSQLSDALLAIGAGSATDRAVLHLGSSAADDWCLYLKAHLENSAEHVEGLNPGFGQCLMQFFIASEATGNRLTIYSGYRSPERQAELFAAALEKYGDADTARKWVAPPPCDAGTGAAVCGNGSMHNRGLAADIRFNGGPCEANPKACAWAHAQAATFGLTFRLGNEPWHIEPSGGSCQQGGAAIPREHSGDTESNLPQISVPTIQIPSIGEGEANALIGTFLQELLGGMSGAGGAGQSAQGVFGNFFDTFLGSMGGQQGTQGGGEFLVITEDGTLIARSNVSAQDALERARIFFDATSLGTSSEHVLLSNYANVFAPASVQQNPLARIFSGGLWQLGGGNTFGGAVLATGTPSGGFMNSQNQSAGWNMVAGFVQQIFGILSNIVGGSIGNLFGNFFGGR